MPTTEIHIGGEVTWEENLKRGAVLVDKADLFWVSKVVPSLQLEFGDLASFEKNKDLLLDVIKAGLVEDLLRDGDKGEFWTPVPVPLLGRRADSSADEATRAKYAKQRELRAKLFQAARNILHRVKTSCFAEEIEAAKRAREEIEAAAAAVGESPEVGDLTSSEPHLPGIFFDDGMEVLLTPETVRGISLQGRVLFVFLPDEKIRQAKKMAQYWNTLPCAKIDPLTQAAVYGEYTIPTLARVWFTTEKGVVLDKNDGTVDWGAGAGKILLSPTFLSPFPQVHRLGVEMDAAAYKLLVQNVSHFKRWHRVEMKGAAGALTVEGSQAPVPPLPTRAVAAASSSSAASSSASRAGVSFPVQVAAPAPLRIDTLNCDSSEIHSWGGGGATIFMQYDGGPQASEFLRAKCQPWITIVRCCMSNPESKVFFSTKLNQNAYDNVINTPDVNLGRWYLLKIGGISAVGSSYQGQLWIRRPLEEGDSPAVPYQMEEQESLLTKMAAAQAEAGRNPAEENKRLASGGKNWQTKFAEEQLAGMAAAKNQKRKKPKALAERERASVGFAQAKQGPESQDAANHLVACMEPWRKKVLLAELLKK